MEKPARKGINVEYKKSTELCRTTSPVMTRKKGRRKSSAKTPPVEEVIKPNNDVGLSYVKRKESVPKDGDETDRKNRTRRRSSGGRRKSSTSSTSSTVDVNIESDFTNVENNAFENDNGTQRRRSSGSTSRPKSPVDTSEEKIIMNGDSTEPINTSKELNGKTGASFEELLNAIDKEFGNKEFFIKTIDKIDTTGYENCNGNKESDEYCNGNSTREEVVNGIDNQCDNYGNTYSEENHNTHNGIEDSVPRTFIDSNGYSVDTETGITDKDSKKNISSTKVHDKDIKSQTITNQDDQTENSNMRADTNDDECKKGVRQFGMRNRPSKPWRPPPKTSQFEFGLTYSN